MIKNLLFTMLFFFVMLGANLGQVSFVVDHGDIAIQDIRQETISHSTIENNSASDTLYLKWERDIFGYEGGWDISICDQNRCYSAVDRSNDNTLIIPPGEQSILDIRVNPKNNFGKANVEVSLTDLRTGDLVGQHTFGFMADRDVVQTKSVPEIMVYPNPTQDIFYLKNDTEVSFIRIYNIVGKELKRFSHMPGDSYDLMTLSEGLYIVRLYDYSNTSLKVLRLQKK